MKAFNLFLCIVMLSSVSCNDEDSAQRTTKDNVESSDSTVTIGEQMRIILNTYSDYDPKQVFPGLEECKLSMFAYLEYNEGWTTIVSPIFFKGVDTLYEGFSSDRYQLKSNGEAFHYTTNLSDGVKEEVQSGKWSFDTVNQNIVLLERIGKVVAFGGGIIVFDERITASDATTRYYRSIYTIE